MARVEEVVGHLRRARVPRHRRERALDEGLVLVLGHPGEVGDRRLRGDPDQAEVLDDAGGRAARGASGDRGIGRLGRDLDARAVGGELVAVVGAAQAGTLGGHLDRAGAQRGQPVRALVLERGKLTVEAGDAPALAEQLHRQRAAVGQLLDAGDRVPAAAQHRVGVVEPHRVIHATPAERCRDRGSPRAAGRTDRASLALRQRLVDPELQRTLLRPMIGGAVRDVWPSTTTAPSTSTVCTDSPCSANTRLRTSASRSRQACRSVSSSTMSARLPGAIRPIGHTARSLRREAHSPDRLRRRPRTERARRGVDQRGELHRLEHVLVVVARRAVGAERHAHALVEQAGERQQA